MGIRTQYPLTEILVWTVTPSNKSLLNKCVLQKLTAEHVIHIVHYIDGIQMMITFGT